MDQIRRQAINLLKELGSTQEILKASHSRLDKLEKAFVPVASIPWQKIKTTENSGVVEPAMTFGGSPFKDVNALEISISHRLTEIQRIQDVKLAEISKNFEPVLSRLDKLENSSILEQAQKKLARAISKGNGVPLAQARGVEGACWSPQVESEAVVAQYWR